VTLNGKEVVFQYQGKSGQRRDQSIVDPDVYSIIEHLKRRSSGGAELLAYRNGRSWVDVAPPDVNDYLKEIAKGDFSAKDFRTWNATMLAALSLAEITAEDPARSKTGRKRVMSEAVKRVAFYLGNTPAVCRSSYIDPRVFDRYQSGWTIQGVLGANGAAPDLGKTRLRRRVEEAVIDLIEEPRESPVVEMVGG
jgi:DNA topoisomerase-1